MRKRFLTDVWFALSVAALWLFYYSLYRSYTGVAEAGLHAPGLVLMTAGLALSILMAGRAVGHRKNIVLLLIAQLVMWLGGLLFYYPLVYRKTIM